MFIYYIQIKLGGFKPYQNNRSLNVSNLKFNFFSWLFINNAVLLLWLGAQLVKEPYVAISQIATISLYFLIILPLLVFLGNKSL
jgi:hypothetical protein